MENKIQDSTDLAGCGSGFPWYIFSEYELNGQFEETCEKWDRVIGI